MQENSNHEANTDKSKLEQLHFPKLLLLVQQMFFRCFCLRVFYLITLYQD
jgi:hypothetical protein